VGVRDQDDVSVGQQRREPGDPGQHPVDPLADLVHALSRVLGVSSDHAVPPQVPAGPLVPDLLRRHALVAAVVPFPEVRVGLGVVQTSQGRGGDRAAGGAGEDGRDLTPGQHRG
jgi:hypothetical protein